MPRLPARFAAVTLGLDDTSERRRGRRIGAKGIYRDPVRSSHGHFVKAVGLRRLSLMPLVPVPWAGRAWALPFLTALAPSERSCRERGRRDERLTDRGRPLVLQARRWMPPPTSRPHRAERPGRSGVRGPRGHAYRPWRRRFPTRRRPGDA